MCIRDRYTSTVELNMGDVVPSVAGPRRPQDRIILDAVKDGFHDTFGDNDSAAEIELEGQKAVIGNGAVALAAITSCTNTSNPSVMIGAGLLAKKAVERGMASKPWVKTSMAPGSQVVTDYIDSAGLTSYLEQLGFHTVGYGCTTCIGNSGSLPEAVSSAIAENDLSEAAVVSGNRNFESRIHAEIKATYLASPILVVAYALAGTMNIDLTKDSLGEDNHGNPIYLRDIWPSQEEIRETVGQSLDPKMFKDRYGNVSAGPAEWTKLDVPEGDLYEWDPTSTYIQDVPFFKDLSEHVKELDDIVGDRLLVKIGE